jgi:integrase
MKIRMKDGSGFMELKFVVEDVDRHGNVRIYYRHAGIKVRLRETPGTPEFMAAYHAARSGAANAKQDRGPALAGTLRWLVERYYISAEFKGLSGSTRRVRRNLLDGFCAEHFAGDPLDHGAKPFARMEGRHVRRLRDERAERPEAANARVKALRQVFAWAVEANHAHSNPAREVSYIRRAGEGFHAWTIDEVRQFEARHPLGSKPRLALALLLYTGVRRSDVVRLGRQMEQNGWLRFTEAKGRSRKVKARELPIVPELRAALDATPSGHLTYLVTEFGRPFAANGFGNWFRKRCDEAGLLHCSAHGLRKAGATIAADQGATEHQLMAIYGWESPKQAALYTRSADRKRLVGAAMHLVVPAETVPLSVANSSGGTLRGIKP